MNEFEIGKIYLFTTVRMFVVGKVVSQSLFFVNLEDAIFCRDLGNFDTFLTTLKITRHQKLGRWRIALAALQGASEELDEKVLSINK